LCWIEFKKRQDNLIGKDILAQLDMPWIAGGHRKSDIFDGERRTI